MKESLQVGMLLAVYSRLFLIRKETQLAAPAATRNRGEAQIPGAFRRKVDAKSAFRAFRGPW